MSRQASGPERTARLWEVALVGSLLAIAAAAWFATGRMSSSAMPMGILVPEASMHSPAPGVSNGLPAALALFLLTWTVMMVAMMFPAIVPVVLVFDRWLRRADRSRAGTALFLAGYLLVWASIGTVFYAASMYLHPLLPAGDAALRWGGGLLVVAGAYQLSPLKYACLRQCRSPLAFIAQHSEQLMRGGVAVGKIGARHGLACVGCCWALMLVLALLGMMSLVWMAAVAAVIFLEKVVPSGRQVGVAVAVALLAAGMLLVGWPQLL